MRKAPLGSARIGTTVVIDIRMYNNFVFVLCYKHAKVLYVHRL